VSTKYEHDIAISFAGEDQVIADAIDVRLKSRGIDVFFAPSKQAELLGERLEDVLAKKYGPTSRFVVVLVSDSYPLKDWARFELSIARDEEKQRKEAFILPLLLADKRMVQIPADKAYLDLRSMDLDEVVAVLVEKVMLHRGEMIPNDLFEQAFREWKLDGFIPGSMKGNIFWDNVSALVLDEDRVEFLLRCPSGSHAHCREGLSRIDPTMLAVGAKCLLDQSENQNFKLSAICYLGVADPKAAERELWTIYKDEGLHVNDRARAFELFWKCPSENSHREPKEALLDMTVPWQLRRAAAVNVLCGEFDDDTEHLVERALRDPRQEIRSKILDAVLRFGLSDMSPSLLHAYKAERSRKGKVQIKHALRHFNDRTDVVEFGKQNGFGSSFFRVPTYIHDWKVETDNAWY